MKQIHSTEDMRSMIAGWHKTGGTVALLPTMGNLHQGHLRLAALAAEHATHVVVSIFVNPTQFGPDEDFSSYPRTLEEDGRKLAQAGVDVLFAPAVADMYPGGLEQTTQVIVPGLSDQLCGAYRPGHFQGVASVVCRLLNICTPDVAVFGQKDYQQLVILRQMVSDLHMGVQLIAGATERAASGLALSSRNSYLDAGQQQTATALYSSLQQLAAALRAGRKDYPALEAEALARIATAGLEVEYVAVRSAADLAVPAADSMQLVLLAAARLGGVRLIDNVVVDLGA